MAKGQDAKRTSMKPPGKTLKEKRKAKKEKRVESNKAKLPA